jgi:DNA mismatch repair protein MutS2
MMHDSYLATIEYFQIIDHLVEHCAFSASQELGRKLRPTPDPYEVRQRLTETTEAKALLSTHTDITVGGARDVRPLARHAALWAMLQPADLLAIRATIASGRTLRRALLRQDEIVPTLAAKAENIAPLDHIVEEIDRCLDEDGRVLDSASPELARLRRESAVARARLMERLRAIISSTEGQRYLQEPIITERNRRFVVPIKIEYKGRIPGIIHDQSSSGATLFIEPLATVELNNSWHELQLAEAREVERILTRLSHLVGESAEPLRMNVEILAELDLAFAKAQYSFALRGVPATLTDQDTQGEGEPLQLLRARHPLLPAETVVPIDVHLGDEATVLLITGPNTGGKTVSLKTVGLLSAMSQAGLHIPAADGSRLPVFSGIYADIGDEQSIEQSLSTFSSHMTHIIDILEQADDRSLVLLDEVGVGTDPVEGAALAQALIDELLARRCLTVCSSHYARLKAYAYETPGVQNAAVEFDLASLSPTYRLTIGLPGRSYAFAIARQLGLPEAIIEKSQSLVSPDDLQVDVLLANIKDAHEAAQTARAEAEEKLARIEAQERQLRTELSHIEAARRQVLEEARQEGREELARWRAEIERMRRGVVQRAAPEVAAAAAEAQELDRLEEEMRPVKPAIERPVAPAPERVQVGDTVYVPSLKQTGQVLRLEEGEEGAEAEVAVGGMRLRVDRDAIEFHGRPLSAERQIGSEVRRPKPASPGMELDLRGYRAEEVHATLDKYLDEAYLAGLPWVHIIHGKGGGVLKQVVRDQLRDHPLVRSFRRGELSEGGDGNTVVELVPVEESSTA